MKLVYIAGYGRSGSTLLGTLLAKRLGGVFVGETVNIGHRAEDPTLGYCGCGATSVNCEFWGRVLPRLKRATSHLVSLPAEQSLIVSNRSPTGRKPAMAAWFDALFSEIASVAGEDALLVDSSKLAGYGDLAAAVLGRENVFYVQLVRDPRAVAYSLRNPTPYIPQLSDVSGTSVTYMPTRGLLRSSLAWMRHTQAGARLMKRGLGAVVRYEDLVAQPEATLDRLAHVIGGSMRWQSQEAHIHAIAGNPARFNHSAVVSPDNRWTTDAQWRHAIVWALTAPVARQYSYGR